MQFRPFVLCLAATALGSCHDDGALLQGRGLVVGGAPTTIEQHPYQVILMRENKHFTCGGSLISPEWILTAAHCIPSVTSSRTLVARLGTSHRLDGGTDHALDSVFVHPKFNSSTLDYDVALLHLEDAPDLDDSVQPVKVADLDETPVVDELLVVTGWGRTETEKKKLPGVLQEVSVPVVDWEVCEENYARKGIALTDRMFCAGTEFEDACKADSGGPLVRLGDVPVQVGIVSWGINCAAADLPGVYTNLVHPEIQDFICSNARQAC